LQNPLDGKPHLLVRAGLGAGPANSAVDDPIDQFSVR
jgi:hypothetical protein